MNLDKIWTTIIFSLSLSYIFNVYFYIFTGMHFFILQIVNEGDPVLACAILERKMQRLQVQQ